MTFLTPPLSAMMMEGVNLGLLVDLCLIYEQISNDEIILIESFY